MKKYTGTIVLMEDKDITCTEDKVVVYKKSNRFQITTTAIIREMYLFPELVSFFHLIVESKFVNEIDNTKNDTIAFKISCDDYQKILDLNLINKEVIFTPSQETEFVVIDYAE